MTVISVPVIAVFRIRPYLLVVDVDLHNGVDVEDGGVSAETLALQRQIFVGVEIRHIRFGQDDVVGVRHHV